MATSKKKTAPKADAEPRDEAAEEETPTDETVEEPRTADEADAPTSSGPTDGPRPWRVETFETDERWGWRLCDATGVIVHETNTTFESKDEAVNAAKDDDRTEGARFLDLERGARW